MGFPETFGSGSVVMGDTAILAQRACVSLNVPRAESDVDFMSRRTAAGPGILMHLFGSCIVWGSRQCLHRLKRKEGYEGRCVCESNDALAAADVMLWRLE